MGKIQTKKILPPDIDDAKKTELIESGEYDWVEEETPFLYLTADLPPTPLFQDEHQENFIRKFQITRLPPYIILYIQRFTKNTFYVEKNPTIVNFPVKGIDFGDFLTPEAKEKHQGVNTSYDLIANVVHEGLPTTGIYKVHVLHKGSNNWYEMQ